MTPSARAPEETNDERYPSTRRWDVRRSSDNDRNRAENALLISPTVAMTCSGGEASSLDAAALARHSTRPGSNNRVHCRRMGLPEVEATMSVLAQ